MSESEPSFGPLQMVVVGFETADRFRGDIVGELRELRGRGMIRVLDARLYSRSPEDELTELDLNPLLADAPVVGGNPVAHLLGLNGAGGNGGSPRPGALAQSVGFSVEDLRQLTQEIGRGDIAAMVLVEHLWATHLREKVREAGGFLLSQGMLTPEAMMIVGAEAQATADALAAIELAEAARGSALLEALATFAGRADPRPEPEATAAGAARVVETLVEAGFVHHGEASAAVQALATAGVLEAALVEAAVVEAESLLAERGEGPPGPAADG